MAKNLYCECRYVLVLQTITCITKITIAISLHNDMQHY